MTNRKPNQAAQILAHMEAGKSITPIVALMQFGCLRLSARVYELKLAGHVIQSAKVQTGNGKWVAKYWID